MFILNLKLVFAIDSKAIQMFDIEFVKSGTLSFTGSIDEADLKLYVPQEGLKDLQVYPNSWKYAEDDLGNKMVQIHWSNPSAEEKYEVKMHVVNSAKYFENISVENWKFAEEAKRETNLTKSNDEIREWAYAQETDLEKTVRLTMWINQNIKHEFEEMKERTESAEWVWRNRKGACGEFSNLLIAALRSQNIPARYIVGYVFSESRGDSLWPHAWVEVLIDNKWVPFDPTWMEGGFLDAAHIKFANLMDSNFFEEVSYRGTGSVRLIKDPVSFKILNYSEYRIKIKLSVDDYSAGEVGLAVGEVESFCSLTRLDLQTCADESDNVIFNVFDKTRRFWFCNKEKIYWIFEIPEERTSYVCPTTLYDQAGAKAEKNIKISGQNSEKEITIRGPEQVLIGENFTLETDRSGLFFSPNFTSSSVSKKWQLNLKVPGRYVFYFYSEKEGGKKIVDVISRKDFYFVKIEKPANATVGSWFLINATIKNIANDMLPVSLEAQFQNQTLKKDYTLGAGEEKDVSFNLTASQAGVHEFLLTMKSKTISSYSGNIEVVEERTFLKTLLEIINRIIQFFENLLMKKT